MEREEKTGEKKLPFFSLAPSAPWLPPLTSPSVLFPYAAFMGAIDVI